MLEKNSVILRILEVARWAPSGDNSQPWRFTILSHERFMIHPTSDDQSVPDIYNGDGRAKWFSIGALIENISIAASTHGYKVEITPKKNFPQASVSIEIILKVDHHIKSDELYSFIEKRSVQRGCMKRRRLTPIEKAELASSVPFGVNIEWIEKGSRRWGLLDPPPINESGSRVNLGILWTTLRRNRNGSEEIYDGADYRLFTTGRGDDRAWVYD